MVSKVAPISCVADFKGSNKQFKEYIEKEDIVKNRNFSEILADAKNKLNGECK